MCVCMYEVLIEYEYYYVAKPTSIYGSTQEYERKGVQGLGSLSSGVLYGLTQLSILGS